MITDTDSIAPVTLPEFIDKTTEILNWLKDRSKEELKAIWKCNDKILEQNFNRLENMNLYQMLTPAVLSYEGIAFQYMAPSVFEDMQFEYVQNHLRILSAFYGVLKPMDGVTPYRLEMQAKVGIGDAKNLYEYWGDLLYRSVIDDSRIIINLASKEYSKCIEKYLIPQDRYITVTFCELSGDKLVTKGTYAKMARGEMVRFMAGASPCAGHWAARHSSWWAPRCCRYAGVANTCCWIWIAACSWCIWGCQAVCGLRLICRQRASMTTLRCVQTAGCCVCMTHAALVR